MRQIVSPTSSAAVPLAPLLLPMPCAAAAASLSTAVFPADGLREGDVLLRKGGRPTHGKVSYFRFLEAHAAEYASYKSPIDRRLLARELVESWLARGGRFCTTAATPAPAPATTRKDSFRVASTEEALQFTRRVLVRHFAPGLGGAAAAAAAAAAPKKPAKQNSAKDRDGARRPKAEGARSSAAIPSAATPDVSPQHPRWKDLERATSEAADALCYLRFVRAVAAVPDPPPACGGFEAPTPPPRDEKTHCVSPTSQL